MNRSKGETSTGLSLEGSDILSNALCWPPGVAHSSQSNNGLNLRSLVSGIAFVALHCLRIAFRKECRCGMPVKGLRTERSLSTLLPLAMAAMRQTSLSQALPIDDRSHSAHTICQSFYRSFQ